MSLTLKDYVKEFLKLIDKESLETTSSGTKYQYATQLKSNTVEQAISIKDALDGMRATVKIGE